MITKKDKRLAKQLKKFRKIKRLTQEEVAEKTKVTSKYIQYLESAKRVPSVKLIYRLADVLEIKVRDLFNF